MRSRFVFIFTVFLGLALPQIGLRAQDSARAALGILEQRAGAAEAANVVAVVGFNGQSQPESWKILVKVNGNDQTLREYIVQKRQLLGPTSVRRTPELDLPRTPILLTALRIDSTEVFRIADDAAIANGVGFDRVSYQLRWRGNDPEPTWLATLIDSTGSATGSVYIGANSGQVTHQSFGPDVIAGRPTRGQAPRNLTPVSANAAQGQPRAVVAPVAPAPAATRQPQPAARPAPAPVPVAPEASEKATSRIWLLNPAKRRDRRQQQTQPAPVPNVPDRYRPR